MPLISFHGYFSLLSVSPFIYMLLFGCFFFPCTHSGSAHVKVHNLLRALQANRSLSVHSHIHGKIQANKVKVAVLISGTGESYILYYSIKQAIEKGTFSIKKKISEVLTILHGGSDRLLTGFQ